MENGDIFAYSMLDQMTYVGNAKEEIDKNSKRLENFIIIPTLEIAQSELVPEIYIRNKYEVKNKGRARIINLDHQTGYMNVSLNIRLMK